MLTPSRTAVKTRRLQRILAVGVAAAALAGCATPQRQVVYRTPPPQPPVTEVVAYPQGKKSDREIRQDRYECYLWAVRASGYDPARMRPTAAPPAPRVLADPPGGHDTAAGAIAGAVVGAAVSSPHHAGEGAAIGAAVGAIAGAASDAARVERAERIEEAYAERAARADYGNWGKAEAYRRALSACLEGRGYAVR